jgi:hypothetical protein
MKAPLVIIGLIIVFVVRSKAISVTGTPDDNVAAWTVRHPIAMVEMLFDPPPPNPNAAWLWTHRDLVALWLSDPPPHGS